MRQRQSCSGALLGEAIRRLIQIVAPYYYAQLRPCAPHRYSGPYGASTWTSPFASATGSHVPHKNLVQRHAASMPDAVWAVSRSLPDLSRANETHPVLAPSMTRHQRFACARLLDLHLTGSIRPTLTTIALYDSSLRWFEACSCKPTSRGHTLISCAAWLLGKCLNHSSSFAPSWRTLVDMPFDGHATIAPVEALEQQGTRNERTSGGWSCDRP